VPASAADRGRQVRGVAAVVHFDRTDEPMTYLLRSSRSARAGSDGRVVSLVTADQRGQVGLIQRMVGLSHTFVDPAVDALASIGERTGKPRMEENRRSEETRRPRRKQTGHRQNRSRNRSWNRR